jgi:GH15 family glucan-1,4-alpha-glucosidase
VLAGALHLRAERSAAVRAISSNEVGLRRALAYAPARPTPLGLLPEQVMLSGEPAWVVPLGWATPF